MKLIAVLFVSLASASAGAIPVGQCFSQAKARAQLASEGHRILSTPTAQVNAFTWFTTNNKDQGYVLRSSTSGQVCVVSYLPNVGSISQVDLSNDVCNKPDPSSAAAAACERFKQSGLEYRRSVSANSPVSNTTVPLSKPVVSRFSICRDKTTRKEVLCGIADTLQSEQPR